MSSWSLTDSSVVKSIYCSCRGTEFSSPTHHTDGSHPVTPLQEFQCPMLALAGSCTVKCPYDFTNTHTYLNKNDSFRQKNVTAPNKLTV